MPFKDDKYFYGLSADIGPLFGGIDTTLFAIEQRDRSIIDRQAVGAEFRYFAPDKSALATIDYDVHFQQLNAAIFSGSWTLPDKSTVTAGFDYRKVPYLSAWTALQGQPYLTLYDMLRFNTNQEVNQLAIDRTPTYRSAMIGYSRPITDKLSVSADVTATDVSGTIASGGVDGTVPVGTEFYYSAQLIGTGILKDGDIYTRRGALRRPVRFKNVRARFQLALPAVTMRFASARACGLVIVPERGPTSWNTRCFRRFCWTITGRRTSVLNLKSATNGRGAN